MSEDISTRANADARTFRQMVPATTNFNVAQKWQQKAPRESRGFDFTQRDFEDALDKVSRPAKTTETAS